MFPSEPFFSFQASNHRHLSIVPARTPFFARLFQGKAIVPRIDGTRFSPESKHDRPSHGLFSEASRSRVAVHHAARCTCQVIRVQTPGRDRRRGRRWRDTPTFRLEKGLKASLEENDDAQEMGWIWSTEGSTKVSREKRSNFFSKLVLES